MSTVQPVIAMQGIVKRYYIGKPNELEILHGIDLRVEPGSSSRSSAKAAAANRR